MLFVNKRGVVLLVIMGVILVVSMFAAAVLTIMSSQARLGIYQTNKIKAYYVGMAALHYAHTMMRLGKDPATGSPFSVWPGDPSGNPLPEGIKSLTIRVREPATPQSWNVGTKQIDIEVKYSS